MDGDVLREARKAIDRMGDLRRRVGNLIGVVVILTVVSVVQLAVIAWLISGRIAAGAATAVLKGLGP